MSQGQADLLGLLVAVMAIVVTILAVWIGFILTQKYSQHIDELIAMRAEHSRIADLLEAAHSSNANNLVHFKLTLRVLFNLIMSQQRRAKLSVYQGQFESDRIWAGKVVPHDRSAAVRTQILAELAFSDREMQARQHELYWLVEGENEGEAYLQAIVDTYGDVESLQLMKGLQSLALEDALKERLTVARAELGKRLGQPYYVGRSYDSRSWTGRV